MRIEHLALNTADPNSMAAWYVQQLGFRVVSRQPVHPFTHFLEGEGGTVLLEVYNNPPDQVPGYHAMDPLLLHLAFVSENPTLDSLRLVQAGARQVSEQRRKDGTHLVMLRDPWGFAIQLCKRAVPLLRSWNSFPVPSREISR